MSGLQSKFLAKEFTSDEDIVKSFDPEDIYRNANVNSQLVLDNNNENQMMTSLENKRNESSNSILSKMFSKSCSKTDLPRIESGISVISSVIKKKRKSSKNSASTSMNDR